MAEFPVNEGGTIVAVSDYPASLSFYTDKLGFSEVATYEDPPFAILARGSFRLCLAEEGHPSAERPGVNLHAPEDASTLQVNLVLWVPDCQAAYDALVADGVEFLTSPQSPPWGGSRCFLVDPDGYLIELEELASE